MFVPHGCVWNGLIPIQVPPWDTRPDEGCDSGAPEGVLPCGGGLPGCMTHRVTYPSHEVITPSPPPNLTDGYEKGIQALRTQHSDDTAAVAMDIFAHYYIAGRNALTIKLIVSSWY